MTFSLDLIHSAKIKYTTVDIRPSPTSWEGGTGEHKSRSRALGFTSKHDRKGFGTERISKILGEVGHEHLEL